MLIVFIVWELYAAAAQFPLPVYHLSVVFFMFTGDDIFKLAIALKYNCALYEVTRRKPGNGDVPEAQQEGNKCLVLFALIYLFLY